MLVVLSLNVAGRTVFVVITDAGNGTTSDHGDWAGCPQQRRLDAGNADGALGLTASPASATQINLTWFDTVSNEDGFRVALDDGVTFAPIGTTAAGATSYNDSTVGGGTQYWYRVYAYNAGGDSPSSSVANATTPAGSELPAPLGHANIGAVGVAGSAASPTTPSPSPARERRLVTADGFRYVYQSLSGNGQIVGVSPALQNTNAWAKAGVMFRETLGAGSKQASMHVTPSNGTVFTYRGTTGGSSNGFFNSGAAPNGSRSSAPATPSPPIALKTAQAGPRSAPSRSRWGNIFVGLAVSERTSPPRTPQRSPMSR